MPLNVQAALRRALGENVFFSYVYKANVQLVLIINVPPDMKPHLYAQFVHDPQALLDVLRQLMQLSPEDWRSKARMRQQHAPEDSQMVHMSLELRDVAFWKAHRIVQTLLAEGSGVGDDQIHATGSQQDEDERRRGSWLKTQILNRLHDLLGGPGDGGGGGGAEDVVEFYREHLVVGMLPTIEEKEVLVDHEEEFQHVIKLLASDPGLRRTLEVPIRCNCQCLQSRVCTNAEIFHSHGHASVCTHQVRVQGEHRLICFCRMTEAKSSRLLDARDALFRAKVYRCKVLSAIYTYILISTIDEERVVT